VAGFGIVTPALGSAGVVVVAGSEGGSLVSGTVSVLPAGTVGVGLLGTVPVSGRGSVPEPPAFGRALPPVLCGAGAAAAFEGVADAPSLRWLRGARRCVRSATDRGTGLTAEVDVVAAGAAGRVGSESPARMTITAASASSAPATKKRR
jgi:hypothetical protein